MDDGRGAHLTIDPAGVNVNERVVVQARVEFVAVTDKVATDSISVDLAAGRFPAGTRPAVEYLQSMARPGARVLDLGTHIGSFTLAAAALGYEVVGVEASPRNAALLQASLTRNGFRKARLVHAAVSDRPGTLEFSQGGPFGHVGVPGMGKTTVSVPARTVDEITAELGWDRVDFIKMDIEGSEIAGLRGMPRLLSGPDAPPLFVESNGHTLGFFDQSPYRLKAALADHGYRSYLVELGRLLPVQEDDVQPATCVDYLATKQTPDRVPNIMLDRPLSQAELIFRITAACRSSQSIDRLHIARALREADRSLRSMAAIHAAVQRLRQDPDEKVRAAAELIALRPVRRFWFEGLRPGTKAVPRPHMMERSRAETTESGPARR